VHVTASLNTASRVVLPLAVAVIMFCLGLGLRRADFARMLRRPRLLAVALPCQLALLPLAAWAVGLALALDPSVRVGLLLIAACPISVPANVLARVARADVAAAVTLTALTAPAAAVTIPIILRVRGYGPSRGGSPGSGTLWLASLTLMALVTLPVLLGLTLREAALVLTRRLEPRAIRVAVVMFVLGLAVAIAASWKNIPQSFSSAGVAAILLNVVGLVAAGGAARLAHLPPTERVVLELGCTTRQFTVAAFVALNLCQDPKLLVPAIAYCLIMWVPALGSVLIARGRAPAAEASCPPDQARATDPRFVSSS
jgi:BASS family bile acid:Na+ symporter